MEDHEFTVNQILKHKIIAIGRGLQFEEALLAAEALYAGGIRLLEVTFNPSDPNSYGLIVVTIRKLADVMQGRMLIGAGTVLDETMVEAVHAAGARYIVSPDTNPKIIAKTVKLGMVSIPGALTPTEAMQAYRAGADFVKFFPAAQLGTAYLKSIRNSLTQLRILAVGGIDSENCREFLDAGAVGVGIGGKLVSKEWIRIGETHKITALAQQYVQVVQA